MSTVIINQLLSVTVALTPCKALCSVLQWIENGVSTLPYS